MYWFIGTGVKNSIDIMVEATAVNTIDFPLQGGAFLTWSFNTKDN